MKLAKKGVVGINGRRIEVRNVAYIPRTRQSAFFLLDSIETHLRNSGLPERQAFEMPKETLDLIHKKCTAKVSQLWVRKQVTDRKRLADIQKMPRRIRRVQYKQRVQVFTVPTVPILRAAVPKMYGQGFLRKSVAVHPYRPMDTFMALHRVNVYRIANRFDVVDALCNIPILAGLTQQGLKKVVSW